MGDLCSESFGLLADNGITKPSSAVCLEDKDKIAKLLCLNQILLKCFAELQQLSAGFRHTRSVGVHQKTS